MRTVEFFVTSIEWERIHMYVKVRLDKGVQVSENVQFLLVNAQYQTETEFDIVKRDRQEYLLHLNVTNNGTNRCVNNGIYTLLLSDGDELIGEAGYEGTSQMLEAWGRCFRYNGNSGAYTATFLLDEYAEVSRFQLLFYNTNRKGMSNMVPMPLLEGEEIVKESFLSKKKAKLFGKLKKKYRKYQHKIYRSLYRLYHGKSNKKETILFMSEQDNKLALNMQAVVDRIRERGLEDRFELLFSLRNRTSAKQTIGSTIHMMKSVAKADIIIVDDHVPLFDRQVLNEETKVIQLWHAGAGFKGVGYSRWGHCGCPGPFCAHRQYDYCISGSSNISGFFSEQFGILDEQILPTGMPRMDAYLNKENRAKITADLYEKVPAAKGKKVLLFAPTYRGRNRANAYYPYERIDFDRLYEFCKSHGYIVFFKMHPWVAQSVPIKEEHKEYFYDMNTYPNINELFYITDLLITDYSSSIYEFSLMNKPMLFFVYDKVQYSTSRGFHRDYDSTVPGKVCESFDEIMDALEAEDFEFEKVAQYVKDHFDFVDDHATDRVIDWLLLDQMPEIYQKALQEKREKVAAVRGKSFAQYFVQE